jgi:thiol-disulfide isomerase/thioredoxin
MLYSQDNIKKTHSGDPFLNAVKKMYFIESVSFNALSKKKGLFELDTSYSRALVKVRKTGDSIIFLQIINSSEPDELLLYYDSVWYVHHQKKEMRYIGNGLSSTGKNFLSEHFPASLYTIDTLINQVDPFWTTIAEDESYHLVSIDIIDKPEEVTDLKVEVMIKRSDSMIYSLVKDAGFKGMTARLYQEESFRNYTFPRTEQFVPPDYLIKYERIFPGNTFVDALELKIQDTLQKEVILDSIELFDLDGNIFSLPEEGLIFFDLWYVGCFPCMKAAPVIERLYHDYKNRVHFFSVNEIDTDKEKIMRFKDIMNISSPVLIGGKEKLAIKVNRSNAYPSFILLNASDGKVLWHDEGFHEDLEKTIREIFDKYL